MSKQIKLLQLKAPTITLNINVNIWSLLSWSCFALEPVMGNEISHLNRRSFDSKVEKRTADRNTQKPKCQTNALRKKSSRKTCDYTSNGAGNTQPDVNSKRMSEIETIRADSDCINTFTGCKRNCSLSNDCSQLYKATKSDCRFTGVKLKHWVPERYRTKDQQRWKCGVFTKHLNPALLAGEMVRGKCASNAKQKPFCY